MLRIGKTLGRLAIGSHNVVLGDRKRELAVSIASDGQHPPVGMPTVPGLGMHR
jgi:hypothetical protein